MTANDLEQCLRSNAIVEIPVRKVVPYSITSVRHGAPGFLAVSPQVTLVINPAVGCRYFPPRLRLLSQPKRSPQLRPLPFKGLMPLLKMTSSSFRYENRQRKLKWWSYNGYMARKTVLLIMFSHFDTARDCDRQTDRQTCRSIYCTSLAWRHWRGWHRQDTCTCRRRRPLFMYRWVKIIARTTCKEVRSKEVKIAKNMLTSWKPER